MLTSAADGVRDFDVMVICAMFADESMHGGVDAIEWAGFAVGPDGDFRLGFVGFEFSYFRAFGGFGEHESVEVAGADDKVFA
jgi:hypothetical protein